MKNGLCKKILIPVCGHIVNLDKFYQPKHDNSSRFTVEDIEYSECNYAWFQAGGKLERFIV